MKMFLHTLFISFLSFLSQLLSFTSSLSSSHSFHQLITINYGFHLPLFQNLFLHLSHSPLLREPFTVNHYLRIEFFQQLELCLGRVMGYDYSLVKLSGRQESSLFVCFGEYEDRAILGSLSSDWSFRPSIQRNCTL